MPTSLIIDDRGRVWPAHSPDLMRKHGDAERRIDDLVHDLGFLRIDTFRSSQMVTFRPARTAPASIIGAFYTVMEFLPRRVALKFFVADEPDDPKSELGWWRREIHGDIDLALHRIEDLVNRPGGEPQCRVGQWSERVRDRPGTAELVGHLRFRPIERRRRGITQ